MTLERMALRSNLDKFAAYFYIPVDQFEEVQQAQYDVLDLLNADLVTLEPQKPDRLHISLLYIERIKDDDLEEFFNKLNLIMPVAFNVEVVRSGTFNEADEKPLVLHLAPHPALLRLQQELYDTALSMGLPVSVFSKPKYYNPHISIAYNYMPQDIKIPDLKAPFKIPIYNFVCTRKDYELVRTITLPNYHNEEVLVTREIGLGGDTTPTGQSGATTPGETDMTPGTKAKREKDQRIAAMVAGDEAEPKLPKEIRIVYTPELEIECRQTRSREFVDIELGPPFWDIGDRGLRAGALAFQFGNILADEMIMGLGGPHEWARADAMLQAPPMEQQQGYRFIFGTNSITWAASYAYASYIVNGPEEMNGRGYHDGVRWIEIALEQLPDYDAENAPDFHSLVEELGDFPPEGVVPEYLIGKGGPGSGHKGHKGRPGEVGGSLPSGAAGKKVLKLGKGYVAISTKKPKPVSQDDLFEINQADFRFEGLREETGDIGPDFDMLDVDDAIADAQEEIQNRMRPILIDFMEDVGHAPRDIVFTDAMEPIFEEYWGQVPEEQRDEQWREVASMLYMRGTKATYTGSEDYPDHTKFIHFNIDLMLDDMDWSKTQWAGGELNKLDPSDDRQFRQAVSHELGHWLSIEADARRNPPEGFRGPDKEYKVSNRIFDDRTALSEYQADLVASMTLGDMGFRGWGRDLTPEEVADRDLLMTLIDERMAEKAALVEKAELPKPILMMIPWGDGYEGTIISSDDLPPGVDDKNLVGIIYRGGPGSGHHEHEGRPGEVGGSQPGKGTMAVGGVARPKKAKQATNRQYASKEFGERLDAQIGVFENAIGGIPDRVLLITDDVDAAVRATLDKEKERSLESVEKDEREGDKYAETARQSYEDNWSEEGYQGKYDRLRGRIENRLSGGTIPVSGGDEVVVYVSEQLTAGEYTYTNYSGQEKTTVGQADESEYVITHELTHALMESRDMYRAVRRAHLDYLDDPKYEHRMQEILIPRSYRRVMAKFYTDDLNAMENEFYADMISYGIRLEKNPDENRVMIGGNRTLTTDDWFETDENPQEIASNFLSAVRDYVRDQEEAGNDGE